MSQRSVSFAGRREEVRVSGYATFSDSSAPVQIQSDTPATPATLARTDTGTYTITLASGLETLALKGYNIQAHQTSDHVEMSIEFQSYSAGVFTFKTYTEGAATDTTGTVSWELTLGV